MTFDIPNEQRRVLLTQAPRRLELLGYVSHQLLKENREEKPNTSLKRI